MPNLDVCGTIYPYPNTGDKPWGDEHVDWATAVSQCVTQNEIDIATKVTDPMTTQGDIIFNDATLNPARLGIGTLGQILAVNGAGEPQWTTPSLVASPLTTDGDIYIRSGGVDARLPIGSNGQVLLVSGGLPTWQSFSPGTGDVVGPAAALDGNIATYDGTTGKLIKLSGVNIDGADNVNIGGDIELQKPTFNWVLENPDDGNLNIKANGDDRLTANSANENITVHGDDDIIIDPDDINAASTPTVNTIYPNSIIKAWAHTNSGGTIQDGLNLSVSKPGTGTYQYTFNQNMANANYAVLVIANETGVVANTTAYNAMASIQTSGQFQVFIHEIIQNLSPPTTVDFVDKGHTVLVIGTQ